MGNFKVTQQYKGATHDGLDLVGLDSKEVHSTVNGVVEYAGWENASNHKQGFGQYVKIRDSKTGYRFYFGHLSKINVKIGQTVKVTDVIGIEGDNCVIFTVKSRYSGRTIIKRILTEEDVVEGGTQIIYNYTG